MKANELRLGNFIQEKGGEIFPIPSGEYIDDATIKFYKSVPLTEEWLLKLGFENKFGNHRRSDGIYFEIIYFISNNTKYWFHLRKILNEEGYTSTNLSISNLKIKYVHQLQNIFHAISGRELVLAVRAVAPTCP